MKTKGKVQFQWALCVSGLVIFGISLGFLFFEENSNGDPKALVWLVLTIVGAFFAAFPFYEYFRTWRKQKTPVSSDRMKWLYFLCGFVVMLIGWLLIGAWVQSEHTLLSMLDVTWRIGVLVLGGLTSYHNLSI